MRNPAPVALACLLCSSTLWGLSWLPLHALRAAGIEGILVVAIAFGAAALLALPALVTQRAAWHGKGHWLLAIAVLGGFANLAFTLAMSYGEVVRVMVLFYLLPVWGVLGGWIFLGERPGRRRVIAMLAALAGAGLILGADTVLGMRLAWQDWLAIACGLAFTGNNLVFRQRQDLPIASKTAAMLLGAPLLAGALLGLGLQSATVPTASATALAALYGLGVATATALTQIGVTHLEAGRVAILIVLELVVAVVSAVLLGADTLVAREWAGVALVLVAAVLEACDD